jgi:hypothetical protein
MSRVRCTLPRNDSARARADADDVGAREGVAQHRLERDAAEAEAEPGDECEHGAGEPQPAHRERRAWNILPEHDAEHLAGRVDRLAEHERRDEHGDDDDREREQNRAATAAAAQAQTAHEARRVGCAGLRGGRGCSADRHSSRTFCRRTM